MSSNFEEFEDNFVPAFPRAGWIGVDLDGTLAEYHGWTAVEDIGAPIPKMVARVKEWREMCIPVKIFTARIDVGSEAELALAMYAIQNWCMKHIGEVLPITDRKDYAMIQLWDDRCVQVIANTGMTLEESLNVKTETH